MDADKYHEQQRRETEQKIKTVRQATAARSEDVISMLLSAVTTVNID